MKKRKIVVALGGNAIQTGDASAEAQKRALEETAMYLADMIDSGAELIITHGNGPQVGNLMIQQKEADSPKTPAMPLETCVSMTQGMIGYWLQNALDRALHAKGKGGHAATVITRVAVRSDDEAFRNPTKPIGPFYSEEEAKELMNSRNGGLVFKEDAGRGWRRVVPSPARYRFLNTMLSMILSNTDISSLQPAAEAFPSSKTAMPSPVLTPSSTKTLQPANWRSLCRLTNWSF